VRLLSPLKRSAAGREIALFGEELNRARLLDAGKQDLQRVRAARLREVLRAASQTRMYGPSLSPTAVREGRIDDLTPVTKKDFLERLDDTFVDHRLTRARLQDHVRAPERAGQVLDGRYIAAMTSGTTGQVGIFVNDLDSWAKTRGVTFARIFRGHLGVRDLARLVRYRGYKMAFIVATGGHFMTSLLAQRVPSIGRVVVDSRALSIESPLPAIVRQLNDQKPHLLHSYPTVLELLCAEVHIKRLCIDPEVITSGSEPLSASCRDAVADAFPNARLVETYAATECVPLATTGLDGELWVNDDACVLEPVDEHGNPVGPGTVADRVLVTNLLNTVQPVVRYTLTDQVELLPPADGVPFTRLRVHGRTDDTFFLITNEGTWQAHPPIPLEVMFLRVPGLLQYQLIHDRQNELRVLFVVEEGAHGAQVAGVLDQKVSEYLAEHGLLESVSYTLEQIDAIDRHSESRKVRQILSRVPRPGAAAQSAQQVRERRRAPRMEP
jgi:phenylacetate-CoA ligase